jgi:hypothetical protein
MSDRGMALRFAITPEIDFLFGDIDNTERIINPNGKMVKMTVVENIAVEEGLIDFSVAVTQVLLLSARNYR